MSSCDQHASTVEARIINNESEVLWVHCSMYNHYLMKCLVITDEQHGEILIQLQEIKHKLKL